MSRRPYSSRRLGRTRLTVVALAAAGALTLLLPAVASASTGHGGGGGLAVALPMGSIFSDILGSVTGFGKDIISTIFSSILTLFFGGSWKILLHPYEIVEWLIGLPGTGYSTAFVPFSANAGGPFGALVKDTQAIGMGLLPLALGANVIHLVSGGVFTRPRDHMHDFGKVFMAGCAIVAWPWLFGQAIDLANTITLAILQSANANDNLFKTLAAFFATAWAGGFIDLLTTLFLIMTALLLVGLIVMKIVLMIVLAALLVAGPIAIAFYPFEFLSRILMLFGTLFMGVAMIPFGWAILFALFAAFGATTTDFNNALHLGILGTGASKIFDLVCCLICFYLAWKWPFIILSRITSLVGGEVAEVGAAFSAFGHGKAGAGAGGGAAGGAGIGGAAADGAGGGLTEKLRSFGSSIDGGAGAIGGRLGGAASMMTGYGVGAKLGGAAMSRVNGMRGGGASAAAGAGGGVAGAAAGAGAGQMAGSEQAVSAAVNGGADAGFDAVRAGGKDFASGGAQLAAQQAAAAAGITSTPQAAGVGELAGVGAGAAGAAAIGGDAPGAANANGSSAPASTSPDQQLASSAAAITRQSGAVGSQPGSPAAPSVNGASIGAGASVAPAAPSSNGAAPAVPAGAPSGSAQSGAPTGGGAASADPRPVLQTPTPPSPTANGAASLPPAPSSANGGPPPPVATPGGPAPATRLAAQTPTPPPTTSRPSAPASGPRPAGSPVGHGHQPQVSPQAPPAPSVPARSAESTLTPDSPAQPAQRPTPPPIPNDTPRPSK